MALAGLLLQQDQNPFLRAFLPPPINTHWKNGGVAAALSVSNTLNAEGKFGVDETVLRVDAEMLVLNVSWMKKTRSAWSVGVEFPLLHQGGGILDALISDYHESLGLPNKRRRNHVDNRFYYQVSHRGELILNVSESGAQWGDLALQAQRNIINQASRQATMRLRLELPTGNSEALAGSGSVDLSVAVEGRWAFARQWSLVGEAGGVYSSLGDILPEWQRQAFIYADVGLGYQWSPSLELAMQLDGHSAVFDAPTLRYLDDTLLLSLGGRWAMSQQRALELSVNEDIKINASPDISVQLGLFRYW